MVAVAAYKAGQFVAKNKAIVAILLLVVIVGFYFYRKGKKTTTISDLPSDAPAGTQTGNGGVSMNGNQISSNEVSMLAEQVHQDITCIFCTRNFSLYDRLGTLSDTDLIRVYNAYNSKFQAADGETMLQALDNEMANFDVLKNRLRKYNVK